jgi:RNA recognition motif-containing protein
MNIYVGNLSFKLSEDDVQKAFAAFGQVSSVAIIKDKLTGRSRGFAFVEMPEASEAQAAIAALNGKDLGGRSLTVNEARPREERPRSYDRGKPGGPRRSGGYHE